MRIEEYTIAIIISNSGIINDKLFKPSDLDIESKSFDKEATSKIMPGDAMRTSKNKITIVAKTYVKSR